MRKDRSSLVGKRYGRLKVLELADTDKGHNRRWLCLCDCGNTKIILGTHLKNGTTQSCGCLKTELKSNWNIIHGQSRKTTYRIWDGMRRRCQDPKNPDYKYYGGKGVSVCAKWQKFAGFFEDMGVRPPGLTIERINSNGNYEKDNCRWATVTDNLRNRSCVKLTHDKVKSIRERYAAGGITQAALGREYNVTANWISCIVNHERWNLQ